MKKEVKLVLYIISGGIIGIIFSFIPLFFDSGDFFSKIMGVFILPHWLGSYILGFSLKCSDDLGCAAQAVLGGMLIYSLIGISIGFILFKIKNKSKKKIK